MKSSKVELIQRGYADEEMIQAAKLKTEAELIKDLNSKLAWERTAAVYALKQPDRFASLYIELLSKEKKLNTRLACSEVLAAGGEECARRLSEWLGMIGHNQHQCIGLTSKKKSYPLPRDLIARIMAKMDGRILPVLFTQAIFSDEKKLSEALDAIGFMVFYHPALATEQQLHQILRLFDVCENEVIHWKAVTALSAYPAPAACRFLEVLSSTGNPHLQPEIQRSLNLLYDKCDD